MHPSYRLQAGGDWLSMGVIGEVELVRDTVSLFSSICPPDGAASPHFVIHLLCDLSYFHI